MLWSVWTALLVALQYADLGSCMTPTRQTQLKEETRQLFIHGYEGYMKYAYPADELRPISCGPLGRDPNPANFGINDIHANASITLVDVLSSLPTIHPAAFPDALEKVCTEISFDQDVKVQVFEMTIRALGSLLSTYQFLDQLPDDLRLQSQASGLARSGVKKGRFGDLKRYKLRLLELALDLGKRLLPAFETTTGIPFARVNLRTGVEQGETVETCTAGAGSLVLEFAVLSRLTGDGRFEALARQAYLSIWNRRSAHNLLGNTIGATHGQWLAPGLTGVGAGMDSYFEYGLKAAILLDDDMYLDIWHDSYAALQTHVRTDDGFIYRPVQFRTLQISTQSTIDSLSAFFPGMQVLGGDIESAIKTHLVFWNLWRKYDGMPESWVWQDRQIQWAGYPGRPEFIESTYYLYKATKDPFYLRVGEKVLRDIERRTKTECGFATMKNVETGELEDRMESFVLSESLKYLYLLFDETSETHLTNRVFTTEGHALSLPPSLRQKPSSTRRSMHRGENLHCPVYNPPTLGGGLVVGIERRTDYEYARSLVFGWGVEGRVVEDKERVFWSESGYCEIPTTPKYSFDIALTPLIGSTENPPPEDPAPSVHKVRKDENTGNFVITDITGIRLGVRWRFDNTGYDVSSIGPHRVRPGQQVLVTDPQMEGYLPVPSNQLSLSHLPAEVMLRFSKVTLVGNEVLLHAIAATATFGREFSEDKASSLAIGGFTTLILPKGSRHACEPFQSSDFNHSPKGLTLLIDRGGCTFLEKALHAVEVGADGIIIAGVPPSNPDFLMQVNGEEIQEPEGLIRPSADHEDEEAISKVKDLGVLYVDVLVGDLLRRMIEIEKVEIGVEMIRLDGANSGGEYGRQRRSTRSGGDSQKGAREGRVQVAGWEVMNLRILEKPP